MKIVFNLELIFHHTAGSDSRWRNEINKSLLVHDMDGPRNTGKDQGTFGVGSRGVIVEQNASRTHGSTLQVGKDIIA